MKELPGLHQLLFLQIMLQMASGFFYPVIGILVRRFRRESPVHRAFFRWSLALSLWALFESAANLFRFRDPSLSSTLQQLSEFLFLGSIPFLLYFYMIFTLSRRRRLSRRRIRPHHRLARFYLMEIFTALLALLSLFGSAFQTHLSLLFPAVTGAEFHVLFNRLFLLAALLFSSHGLKRLLHTREKNPQRVNIRYSSQELALLAFSLFPMLVLIFFLPGHALLDSVLSVFLLLLLLSMGNILRNRGVNYGGLARRIVSGLLYALAVTIPVVLLGKFLDSSLRPILLYTAPGLLIFLSRLYGWQRLEKQLEGLVFYSHYRKRRNADAFREVILRQSLVEEADIRAGIARFFAEHYRPRFFVFYAAEEELDQAGRSLLVQDKNFTRYQEQVKGPSLLFPGEFLDLMEAHPVRLGSGGLLADFLAFAEGPGGAHMRGLLARFVSWGAEVILPVYEESPGTARRHPIAILTFGHMENDKPLDYSDLDVLRELAHPFALALKNEELRRHTMVLNHRLEEEKLKISRRFTEAAAATGSAASAATFVYRPAGIMSEIMEQAERFSHREAPLLITGETGTGKEHIARIIYALSERKGQFVSLNCSAIPHDLIENELFGHEKGAFTGATESTEGLVGRAREGVLFLDEIGELSLQGQVKLLRLVQDGEYERIGSNETLKTNARFIFATNRNLEQEVKRSLFRADLYYRISTFEIRMPPLRERREDIPLLLDHFLWLARQTFHRPDLRITDGAKDLLMKYNWPGNVRELENLILRTVVMNESDVIDATDLPSLFRDEMDFHRKKLQLEKIVQEQNRLEKELLQEALQQSGGNQSRAAEILNISRGSLQYRLRQYGLLK